MRHWDPEWASCTSTLQKVLSRSTTGTALRQFAAAWNAMRRREFLAGLSSAAFLRKDLARALPETGPSQQQPTFSTANGTWQKAYDRALAILAGNVQVLPRFAKPVLIEGAEYAGAWQECAPHESLVYAQFRPDVARNTHMTFFDLQRPDGQLPANNKRSEVGFGQIQMVVPIAATAWELAERTADSDLLEKSYSACSRWDAWLMSFRNTRGTGLIEGFCTYDTGHDNSPRWQGIPPQCPGKDAKRWPPIASLPRLCPDLSATVFGGRVALSSMARALGKPGEADRWSDAAETIRRLILEKLYVAEDAAFYDLDAENHFVKVRSDVLSRVCGEHVVDTKLFNHLWDRQIHNPRAFWPPFPLPSIALDDPTFVRPIARNSWGGPSQALTALRAGRWFDHYGRSAEFSMMMNRWCEALVRDMSFRQQMDPVTGEFTQAAKPGYSPASLVMFDYTWRLAGVRLEGETLHWNIRPGHAASTAAHFRLPFSKGCADLLYTRSGAELRIDSKPIAHLEHGTVRLVTDHAGKVISAVGIAESPQTVSFTLAGAPHRRLTLEANQTIPLT